MSMNRRKVVKAIAAGGALMGLGALMPRLALAAWNKDAFTAKTQDDAMNALYGSMAEPNAGVKLSAPDIAENGAVVPISISSDLADIESLAIFIEKNPSPLSAEFIIPAGTVAEVSTRVRMGQTTNVTAVVKAGGKLYSATKEVKVTIGGCGG